MGCYLLEYERLHIVQICEASLLLLQEPSISNYHGRSLFENKIWGEMSPLLQLASWLSMIVVEVGLDKGYRIMLDCLMLNINPKNTKFSFSSKAIYYPSALATPWLDFEASSNNKIGWFCPNNHPTNSPFEKISFLVFFSFLALDLIGSYRLNPWIHVSPILSTSWEEY